MTPRLGAERVAHLPYPLLDVIDEHRHFAVGEELRRYLTYALRRVPCRFVAHGVNSCVLMTSDPGWAKTAGDLAAAVYQTLEPIRRWGMAPDAPLPPPFPQREDVWRRLRWNVDEGDMPDGLGRFRIHLFRFDLDGGAAREWFDTSVADTLEIRGVGLGSHSQIGRYVSWNGIVIKNPPSGRRFLHAAIEVDFEGSAAGQVAVNRTSVDFSESAKDALLWVSGRWKEQEASWLCENRFSPFWAHALRISSRGTDVYGESHWAFRASSEDKSLVRPVIFPAVTGLRRTIHLNGVNLEVLELYPDSLLTRWEEDVALMPHRVVVQRGNRLNLLLVWDDDRNTEAFLSLPPSWRDVVVISAKSQNFFSLGTDRPALPRLPA